MNDQSDPITCPNDTQQFTIQLPRRLAKRADKYTKANGGTVTNLVIEALDTFLRGQQVD